MDGDLRRAGGRRGDGALRRRLRPGRELIRVDSQPNRFQFFGLPGIAIFHQLRPPILADRANKLRGLNFFSKMEAGRLLEFRWTVNRDGNAYRECLGHQ